MSFKYIQQKYGTLFKPGQRIMLDQRLATIKGTCDQYYLEVEFDDNIGTKEKLHPHGITILNEMRISKMHTMSKDSDVYIWLHRQLGLGDYISLNEDFTPTWDNVLNLQTGLFNPHQLALHFNRVDGNVEVFVHCNDLDRSFQLVNPTPAEIIVKLYNWTKEKDV